MTTTVYKYQLSQDCTIGLPDRAEILSAHSVDGEVFIWVRLNPALLPVPRRFMFFGTGHAIPDIALRFIGTVLMHALVFHVFEVIER